MAPEVLLSRRTCTSSRATSREKGREGGGGGGGVESMFREEDALGNSGMRGRGG
jgi:hypothetical protein